MLLMEFPSTLQYTLSILFRNNILTFKLMCLSAIIVLCLESKLDQTSESKKSFSGMILMPSISAVEYSSKVMTNFG